MSCEVSSNCRNFDDGCWKCRFDENNYNIGPNLYDAIDKKIKHPVLLAEKEQKKEDKKKARKIAKQEKDKDKVKQTKNANKAEKRVVESLNSGRINMDSDIHAKDLVIDVKNKYTQKNPTILVDEFEKTQNDALRASRKHGVLCIINKDGKKFYVMSEQLFMEKFL